MGCWRSLPYVHVFDADVEVVPDLAEERPRRDVLVEHFEFLRAAAVAVEDGLGLLEVMLFILVMMSLVWMDSFLTLGFGAGSG